MGPPVGRPGSRSRAMTTVVALLATAVVGAGCSSESGAAAPAASATASSSVAPPVAAEPVRMTRSAPVRVRIPAIGVDSELMDLGLQDDGTLEVPPAAFPAGWYTGSPTPGELGPSIIAGHVRWNGDPGVFSALRDLEPDDAITVVREDGRAAVFRVTRVGHYSKPEFPTALVYGDIDHAGLRLITCGGPFDPQAGNYPDNVVVFAELVGARDA